jgi:hypothetical protein
MALSKMDDIATAVPACLTRLTRRFSQRDEHFSNNDISGLSQTRTYGAIECSLDRANHGPTKGLNAVAS